MPTTGSVPMDLGGVETVERMLDLVREHTNMDVAFAGRFVAGRRIIEHATDADGTDAGLVGFDESMDGCTCGLVATGAVANVTGDLAALPRVPALDSALQAGARAYVSIPIHLSDGELYGTVCCFSRTPDPTLTDSDGDVLRLLGAIIADRVEGVHRLELERAALIDRVLDAMGPSGMRMVFQPVVDLRNREIAGYEALARFPAAANEIGPPLAPQHWFGDAEKVGAGVDLEAHAIRLALDHLPSIPDPLRLSLNVTAGSLVRMDLDDLLGDIPGERLVVELTEHEQHLDAERVADVVAELRSRGCLIAIDDLGAGYASLERLLRVRPDLIKLDRALTAEVDSRRGPRALASAAAGYADNVGLRIIAEGIERTSQLEAVAALGITHGQGYLLGPPEERPWEAADAL